MSKTEERKDEKFRRKVRPRYHKALIPALIISLILVVILILILNRYVPKPETEEDGLLDRRTPVVAMQTESPLGQDDFVV
jgi:hypothetical protein